MKVLTMEGDGGHSIVVVLYETKGVPPEEIAIRVAGEVEALREAGEVVPSPVKRRRRG